MAHTGALYQVCACLVTKLPVHESPNPVLCSAQLLERPWARLALPRMWVKFSLLAKKEAFTRSRFSASFPICITFYFNKLWRDSDVLACLMSVGIKPTLNKAKLGKSSHCFLVLVAILQAITSSLIDNLTDKD